MIYIMDIKIKLWIFIVMALVINVSRKNIEVRTLVHQRLTDALLSSIQLEYPVMYSRRYQELEFIPFVSKRYGINVDALYYSSAIPYNDASMKKKIGAILCRTMIMKTFPRHISLSSNQPNDKMLRSTDESLIIGRFLTPHRLKLLQKSFPIKPPCFLTDSLGDLLQRSFLYDMTPHHLKKTDNGYVLDLSTLEQYHTIPGLVNLGSMVYFDSLMVEYKIVTSEGTSNGPMDPAWEWHKSIVRCGLFNLSTLKYHFTYTHHSVPNRIAIGIHKCFAPHHPLARLMYPYIFQTIGVNNILGPSLFVDRGVVESTFSYDETVAQQIIQDVQSNIDASSDNFLNAMDPSVYLHRSNSLDSYVRIHLLGFWDIIHAFVQEYVDQYYTSIFTESDNDNALLSFLEIVQSRIWKFNPTEVNNETVLVKILSISIWTSSIRHSLISNNLWNYAPWFHSIPPRVYQDKQPMPLDCLQQLLNTLSVANMPCHQLGYDYSYLALDSDGRAIMKKFFHALEQYDVQTLQDVAIGKAYIHDVILAKTCGASVTS